MDVDMVRSDSHNKIDKPSIRIGVVQTMHLSSQRGEQGDRVVAICRNTFGFIHGIDSSCHHRSHYRYLCSGSGRTFYQDKKFKLMSPFGLRTCCLETGWLSWLAANSRLLTATTLSLLVSFGLISIIGNIQDIRNMRIESEANQIRFNQRPRKRSYTI